jgi:uncharacterized protein (UPF0333 family)
MKTFKSIAIGVLILLTLCASAAAYYFWSKVKQHSLASNSTAKEIQAEATIIARKVDQEGLSHVTIKEAEHIMPINKNDLIAISPGIRDTTAKAIARVGILEKQVESLTIINSTLLAENLKAKELINENGIKTYAYKDKFVDLTYTPSNGIDTLDKGSFDFRYNADLNITQYWKREWFLGAKHSYIDIYSNDPRTTVNGVKRLKFEQRAPNFGLRIQAAANFNPSTGSIGFGPAARIDIGRFSIQGNYTWYKDNDGWRPGITGNYDLIRF